MKPSLNDLKTILERSDAPIELSLEIIEELMDGVAHITGASPEYELQRAIQNVMLRHQCLPRLGIAPQEPYC